MPGDNPPHRKAAPPPSRPDGEHEGVWRRVRARWPYLPLTWKIAIIGLGLITIFEIVRTTINLLQGEYF